MDINLFFDKMVKKLNLGNIIEDQTTPNMIQGISGIFERNPLISKEI